MGKKFATWITMMINLVKITLMNCDRCEEFPLFGQLPKLREMEVNGMNKVKVIGSDSYGGLDSDCKAAKTVTTIYPSLTKLILWDLPEVEEWLEPVIKTGCEDTTTVNSILPAGQVDDHLLTTFSALTKLEIFDFQGVKSLPEPLAKLLSLERLFIWNCTNLGSLPLFEKSSSLKYLVIHGSPIMKERCEQGRPEWFKIQHKYL
ncbi:hypothetical protein ACET3Z_025021 [Daucus carota]